MQNQKLNKEEEQSKVLILELENLLNCIMPNNAESKKEKLIGIY